MSNTVLVWLACGGIAVLVGLMVAIGKSVKQLEADFELFKETLRTMSHAIYDGPTKEAWEDKIKVQAKKMFELEDKLSELKSKNMDLMIDNLDLKLKTKPKPKPKDIFFRVYIDKKELKYTDAQMDDEAGVITYKTK